MENIPRIPATGVDIYVAELIIFLLRESSHFLHFSVALPLPFNPSSICERGIKVVLLSSKVQISFASVHLTLLYHCGQRSLKVHLTPLQCNNPYQLLFHFFFFFCRYLLYYYYYSILRYGDYFHGSGFIGLYSKDWQNSRDQENVTCNTP